MFSLTFSSALSLSLSFSSPSLSSSLFLPLLSPCSPNSFQLFIERKRRKLTLLHHSFISVFSSSFSSYLNSLPLSLFLLGVSSSWHDPSTWAQKWEKTSKERKKEIYREGKRKKESRVHRFLFESSCFFLSSFRIADSRQSLLALFFPSRHFSSSPSFSLSLSLSFHPPSSCDHSLTSGKTSCNPSFRFFHLNPSMSERKKKEKEGREKFMKEEREYRKNERWKTVREKERKREWREKESERKLLGTRAGKKIFKVNT